MVREVLAGSAVVLAAAAVAAAAERPPRHDVVASSHGRSVQASVGSHCTPNAGAMLCEDKSYPLRTKERLRVHARGRVVLEFEVEPQEIDAQLRDRRSRSVYELRHRGRGLRRTIRLPRELPRGTDRLGFFVGYERGDADFEVDLKLHRH